MKNITASITKGSVRDSRASPLHFSIWNPFQTRTFHSSQRLIIKPFIYCKFGSTVIVTKSGHSLHGRPFQIHRRAQRESAFSQKHKLFNFISYSALETYKLLYLNIYRVSTLNTSQQQCYFNIICILFKYYYFKISFIFIFSVFIFIWDICHVLLFFFSVLVTLVIQSKPVLSPISIFNYLINTICFKFVLTIKALNNI